MDEWPSRPGYGERLSDVSLGRRSILRWMLVGVITVVLFAVAGAAALRYRSHAYNGQGVSISGSDPRDGTTPWPAASARSVQQPNGPSYASRVSSNGRYLLDQYGKPFLVKGDSPWALLTKVSPKQAQLWFSNRQQHGYNAAIVSLIGATGNGGPSDDGSTFDGLRPFSKGHILKWEEPYWQRATSYLEMAADRGITVMLYPIDGWTIGHSFTPESIEQCHQYGMKLAQRFSDLPNIVWMSGGDYSPITKNLAEGSDVDHCMDAAMRGLREGGDSHLFSIQLGFNKSVSMDNPYWARRVDWNFVYTYHPTYRAVLDAYGRTPPIPAVLGEANYEGENNQTDTPDTTDETLRRQVLWALTSGASGEFAGSNDWEFLDGWEKRLDTTSVAQIQRLRTMFARLHWWKLVPDTKNELVTAGRGTFLAKDRAMDVLDNDYATASRTADGSLAVVYLPGQHTITVNRSVLARGATATWVDPASGATRDVPMSDTFTTPGANSEGDHDWLLLFTA
jgi:Protein of unknown function (DUF4038)/Putative collagen-binding domain of a collagenase